MAPFIYQEVYDIALKLIEASERNNLPAQWDAYNELEALCHDHQNTTYDHPFQWETLADFTDDPYRALDIYQKALELADKQQKVNYVASAQLAMAENYFELELFEKANNLALKANDNAKDLSNLVLRREISEFLLKLSDTSSSQQSSAVEEAL